MVTKKCFLQVDAKNPKLVPFILRENVLLMAKTSTENAIDWDDVFIRLCAIAQKMLSAKSWCRGQSGSYVGGKEATDYAAEAIERYCENPEKFVATKGDFFKYLAYNLMRSLISNDAKSAENRTSTDPSRVANEGGDVSNYADALEPAVNEYFDDAVDYHTIMSAVEAALEGDEIAKDVFLGLVSGLKRADIIEEFKMTAKQYDNANRRINTVRKEIAQKFNLEPSKT